MQLDQNSSEMSLLLILQLVLDLRTGFSSLSSHLYFFLVLFLIFIGIQVISNKFILIFIINNKYTFIGVQLLYNVVLVSAVPQGTSVVHISPLFQICFPFRSLPSIEQSSLCYSWFTLVIYFIYSSVYISIPISQFILPFLPPWCL